VAGLPEKIDPVQLARLGSLPIKARVIVEGALSGLHRASLRGSSVEFAEHKEYSPGDDLRHLDWKTYAKKDRYYVKQFEQESQLTIYLVLDSSGSMAFRGGGALSKLEYAGLSLAAFAYLAIQQQDKVGLVASGGRRPGAGRARSATGGGAEVERDVEVLVPPRARTTHLHDLLAVLDTVITRGGAGDESPASALGRIAEMSRRKRALILLASDLFDASEDTLRALVQLRAQRHDVSVLHVLDPHELTFPYDGLTRFEALESEHAMLVNPGAIQRDYLDRMNEFLARCKRTLDGAGVDYHLASTERPLEATLLDLLVARSRLGAAPARRT